MHCKSRYDNRLSYFSTGPFTSPPPKILTMAMAVPPNTITLERQQKDDTMGELWVDPVTIIRRREEAAVQKMVERYDGIL